MSMVPTESEWNGSDKANLSPPTNREPRYPSCTAALPRNMKDCCVQHLSLKFSGHRGEVEGEFTEPEGPLGAGYARLVEGFHYLWSWRQYSTRVSGAMAVVVKARQGWSSWGVVDA